MQGDKHSPSPQDVHDFVTADGTAAGGKIAGRASDYGISYALVITPLTVTASLNGATGTGPALSPGPGKVYTKTYDGTTVYPGAAGSGLTNADYTLSGFLTGEGAAVDQPDATYNSPNVVGATTITAALTEGEFTGTGSTDLNNYLLPATASGIAQITPADISLTGVQIAGTRAYDGTTAAMNTDFGNAGAITTGLGETLNVGGQGTLTSANVGGYSYTPSGSSNTLDIGTLALEDGTVGQTKPGLASNYQLTAATFAVTPRVIDLSGERDYDGTATADAGLFRNPGGTIDGVNGETLALTGSGVVGSRNVGTYTQLSGSTTAPAAGSTDFGLDTLALHDGSGAQAGLASNYTLVGGKDTLKIDPLAITVTIDPVTKTYDGTDTVTGPVKVIVTNGDLAPGDTLGSGGSFAYTNPDAGVGDKTVTVGGVAVEDGNGGGNYAVTYVDNTTSTISPAPLTITADDRSKVYGDGLPLGTTAFTVGTGQLQNGETVTGAGLTSLGNLAGDGLTDVGTYTDNITAANATGGNGFNPGNYTITYRPGTLTVTPAPLTININDATKTYGDAHSFTGNEFTFADPSQLKNGNTLSGLTLTSQGSPATANVGQYTINGSGPTGGNGFNPGNYAITYDVGTLTVDPRPITAGSLVAIGKDKVYDGNPQDPGARVTSPDIVNGDQIGFDFGATFDDVGGVAGTGKNVGHGKDVTVVFGSTALTGPGAGNYVFVGPPPVLHTTASITPRVLDLSGVRVFDWTSNADAGLFGNGDGTIEGVAGEMLTLRGTGTVSSPFPGVYSNANDPNAFLLGSLALGDGGNGGLASNYTLVGGVDTLTILNPPPEFFGIDDGTLAMLTGFPDLLSDRGRIATPYGLAPRDTIGPFTGNHKLRHRVVEPNWTRDQFISDLALKLVAGGVRLPASAALR